MSGVLWGLKKGAGVSLVVIVPMVLHMTYREYTPQQQSLETAGVHISTKVVKKDVRKVPGSGGGGFGAASSATRVTGVIGAMSAGARLGRAIDRAKTGKVDPRDMVDEYSIRYAFQTPAGQTFEGRQILSQSQYQWLSEGSSIRVLYLPAEPSINRAVDYSIPFISSSKPKSFAIGVLSVLAGSFLLFGNWWASIGGDPPTKQAKTDPLEGRAARVARPRRAHA